MISLRREDLDARFPGLLDTLLKLWCRQDKLFCRLAAAPDPAYGGLPSAYVPQARQAPPCKKIRPRCRTGADKKKPEVSSGFYYLHHAMP
ncbi:transcriptional regulator [Klebsiella pneumoniae subsp. pneumoniae]|uniref:Transcriptional regulator n=1 Tax=Klebsiella pneumoniae subsp. pneumoniae TaxID=72407 RepID=A0A377ZE97_KLEPN|nr:transcriptional regulator [Klebsiella pneumoniae subsp. pneumoniae]